MCPWANRPRPRLRTLLHGAGPQAPGVACSGKRTGRSSILLDPNFLEIRPENHGGELNSGQARFTAADVHAGRVRRGLARRARQLCGSLLY